MAKENNNLPTGLYWQGKRTEVERISINPDIKLSGKNRYRIIGKVLEKKR